MLLRAPGSPHEISKKNLVIFSNKMMKGGGGGGGGFGVGFVYSDELWGFGCHIFTKVSTAVFFLLFFFFFV